MYTTGSPVFILLRQPVELKIICLEIGKNYATVVRQDTFSKDYYKLRRRARLSPRRVRGDAKYLRMRILSMRDNVCAQDPRDAGVGFASS